MTSLAGATTSHRCYPRGEVIYEDKGIYGAARRLDAPQSATSSMRAKVIYGHNDIYATGEVRTGRAAGGADPTPPDFVRCASSADPPRKRGGMEREGHL
jgi:hypothetical protein